MEGLILDVFEHQNLNDFVEDFVNNHVKKHVESYPDMFYELLYQRSYVCNNFIKVVYTKLYEVRRVFDESQKTNSDINIFALDLSSLNKFLQELDKISESQNMTPFEFVGKVDDGDSFTSSVVSGVEPRVPSGTGAFA